MHPTESPFDPSRRRALALFGGTLAVLPLLPLTSGCSREPEARKRPNVLLISLDSLRPDHLGCYGYRSRTGAPTSANVDRLAREGVLFEHAVSTTSWTMPSHHALFSGLPDLVHGAIADEHGPTLRRVQLAPVLADAGYSTAGFFSGPYLDPRYGFGAGFERYEDVSGVDAALAEASAVGSEPVATARDVEVGYHRASSAGRVSDAGLAWLDEWRRDAASRPFFLFLHYFDVHYDYAPPEEGYARRFWPGGQRPPRNGDDFFDDPSVRAGMDPEALAGIVSYYDGEVLWTDLQVGRVLDRIDALGLAQDTLVVVVSDHGDEFFEHGAKGHRQNLFETTLRIALIARLPGRLDGGRRIGARVSIVDVAPTILELAGALERAEAEAPAAPATAGLEEGMWGRSLTPLVEGRESGSRECLGFLANRWQDRDHPADAWALWTGDHKVIVSKRYDWREQDGERRLVTADTRGLVFDLAQDPAEATDLAASSDPAVARAIARFDAVFGDAGPIASLAASFDAGPPPPPLTQAQQDALAATGYPGSGTRPPRLPPGTKLAQILPPPPRFPR